MSLTCFTCCVKRQFPQLVSTLANRLRRKYSGGGGSLSRRSRAFLLFKRASHLHVTHGARSTIEGWGGVRRVLYHPSCFSHRRSFRSDKHEYTRTSRLCQGFWQRFARIQRISGDLTRLGYGAPIRAPRQVSYSVNLPIATLTTHAHQRCYRVLKAANSRPRWSPMTQRRRHTSRSRAPPLAGRS